MAKGDRTLSDGGSNTVLFKGAKIIEIYDAGLGLNLISRANQPNPNLKDFLKSTDKFQVLYTFKSTAQDGTNSEYTKLRTMVINRTKGQKFTFVWGALGTFTVVVTGFQGEEEAGSIGVIGGRVDLQVVN